MDKMSLKGFPDKWVELIRNTLVNIYVWRGHVVQLNDMVPTDDDELSEMVKENICSVIDVNRDDPKFMLTYGQEGVLWCKGDGTDEEGER